METNTNFSNNGKSASVVSYITIVGWLISYFAMYKDNKTALSTYHLRQSLLLHLAFIVLGFIFAVVITIIPVIALAYLAWAVRVLYFVLLILGAISANNGQQKPLPLVGDKAQDLFSSI